MDTGMVEENEVLLPGGHLQLLEPLRRLPLLEKQYNHSGKSEFYLADIAYTRPGAPSRSTSNNAGAVNGYAALHTLFN